MSLDPETLANTPPRSLSPTWAQPRSWTAPALSADLAMTPPACAEEKLTILSLDCHGASCQHSDAPLSPRCAQPRSWTAPELCVDLALAPPACVRENLTTFSLDCQEDHRSPASKHLGSKALIASLRSENATLRECMAELRRERKVAEIAFRDWQCQALGSFCAGDKRTLFATLTNPPFQTFEAMHTAGGVANGSPNSTPKSSRHPVDQGLSAECSVERSERNSKMRSRSESGSLSQVDLESCRCYSGPARLPSSLRDVRSPSPPPLPPPSPPCGSYRRLSARGPFERADPVRQTCRSPGRRTSLPMKDKGFLSRQWLAQQNGGVFNFFFPEVGGISPGAGLSPGLTASWDAAIPRVFRAT